MKVLQAKLDKIAVASIIVSKAADKHQLTNEFLDREIIELRQDFKRTNLNEFDYQRRSISILSRLSNNNKTYMNILRNNYKLLGRPREINFIINELTPEQYELKGFIYKRNIAMNIAFDEQNKK